MIGAGINGRCLARALSGEGSVALIDQFEPDHCRGSSHGDERITRSSYSSARWVAAMQRAHAEDWPALEADLGEPLLVRGGDAVFFGPEGGELPMYAEAVRAVGAAVDELTPADAKKRFPMFRFDDCERVLHDRTAGVVAAGKTMRGLAGWLGHRGVELRWREPVLAIEPGTTGVVVRTAAATLSADRVAVCAGSWIGRLLPAFAVEVGPARQDVGFWPVPGADPGRFPAWVRLDELGMHYGLPCFEGGMMKAAFHRTAGFGAGGPFDDPTLVVDARPDAVAAVQARLRRWFSIPIADVSRMETCFYANVADDEFLIRWADADQRVLAVSACSGHGFKLGPHTARDAAALLLS